MENRKHYAAELINKALSIVDKALSIIRSQECEDGAGLRDYDEELRMAYEASECESERPQSEKPKKRRTKDDDYRVPRKEHVPRERHRCEELREGGVELSYCMQNRGGICCVGHCVLDEARRGKQESVSKDEGHEDVQRYSEKRDGAAWRARLLEKPTVAKRRVPFAKFSLTLGTKRWYFTDIRAMAEFMETSYETVTKTVKCRPGGVFRFRGCDIKRLEDDNEE